MSTASTDIAEERRLFHERRDRRHAEPRRMGPLSRNERAVLERWLCDHAAAHDNATAAHRAAVEAGLQIGYHSFLKYWRKAGRAESDVVPLPVPAVVPPAVEPPAPPAAPPHVPGTGVYLASTRGTFAAAHVGPNRWRVTLEVETTRDVALSLQGQAMALIHPETRR